MNFKEYLLIALESALLAGEAIMDVYRKPVYEKEFKEDKSPVTEADWAAHDVIMEKLKVSGFPVLSEEGKKIHYNERKEWETFWLVDPLDGTKEFIKRNGDFTVNIALVNRQKAVLGVLYAPQHDLMYFSDTGSGAFRMEYFSEVWPEVDSADDLDKHAISLPMDFGNKPFSVVASRSHRNDQTNQYIESLRKTHPDLEIVSRGSALKFCLVAEGSADIYPRFGPTWEWDTGAGQAIAEAAGCTVFLDDRDAPLIYNKEDLLNPFFIVKRD
jgi:3'(2'), 5'-bisphosphate nucleotidase